ncbi:DUF6647 family protein [Sinorhizobium mexicanum]|uniref:DUF6647 domain-containing protein n=1 Tax=Sinorhizobium mexicanum TaxID=375549 RepID=A0A859QPD8_9HYPH|nr:DUF6647 family protein [Sinorhizobium mexicanum]MBP1887187.1 hypothetical protein [Sinorhizobium mexicanum]QLL60221.1 hypothetical protein FKV68_01570 [Sinorhizobium mexicanum]
MHTLTKQMVPWIFSAIASTTLAASAGEPAHPDVNSGDASRQVVLPGRGLIVEPDAFVFGSGPNHSRQAALKAIAAWLSSELGLPLIDEPPAIEFASAKRMIGLRYRDVPLDRWSGGAAHLDAPGERPAVVAVYDDEARTVYLPDGWTGKTPGEVSVLVHEMVHHIQNVAGLKFACPEEREKTAFEAQKRWLGLFGSDLEAEFGLDPFTLLVRTNCLY